MRERNARLGAQASAAAEAVVCLALPLLPVGLGLIWGHVGWIRAACSDACWPIHGTGAALGCLLCRAGGFEQHWRLIAYLSRCTVSNLACGAHTNDRDPVHSIVHQGGDQHCIVAPVTGPGHGFLAASVKYPPMLCQPHTCFGPRLARPGTRFGLFESMTRSCACKAAASWAEGGRAPQARSYVPQHTQAPAAAAHKGPRPPQAAAPQAVGRPRASHTDLVASARKLAAPISINGAWLPGWLQGCTIYGWGSGSACPR